MSGQKGQHGPHFLKCSKCKLKSDVVHTVTGRAVYISRSGALVRTGLTKTVNTKRCKDVTAYEMKCLDCYHVGWYTHAYAAHRPLLGKAEDYA